MTTLFFTLVIIGLICFVIAWICVNEYEELGLKISVIFGVLIFIFLFATYNVTKKYEYIKPTTIIIEEYGDKIILKIDDTALIETNIKWKNKDRIYLKKSSNMWDITNEEYIIKEK